MSQQRATGALFPHTTSPYAEGEECGICRRYGHVRAATHKVGEEDLPADPMRHNWTAYLCCEHFGLVMGPVVVRWCRQERKV